MTDAEARAREFHEKARRSQGPKVSGRAAIITVAMLGNMASVNTMLVYTLGVFIASFSQDYGWSRADTSLSMTCFTLVAFLGSALIGRLADRLDPGRVASASMLGLGLVFLSVPYLVHSVASLWATYVLLAVVGLGTSPVVMNKPVIASISRRRGLGIGLALAGTGIGAFAAPQFATALIERGGWKLGYIGLGCVAIVVAPVIWLVLGRRTMSVSSPAGVLPALHLGWTFREASRSRTFWLLSAIAFFGGLGMSGPAAHLIPLLRDHAVTASGAAAIASILGIASIIGRLVTGFTLDRVDGPLAGLLFLALGVIGILLLAFSADRAAAPAGFLLGFVIGAEVDLLAYFISRYFGLRAHATVFGWTYGAIALGSAIGPVVVGSLRDHQGDYGVALTLSSVALAVAALACPLLGRYRFAVTPTPET